MKRVKEHNIFKNIREVREFDFGVFYFITGGIIISEIHENIFFKWKDAKKIIDACQEIFSADIPRVYIANRINSYYVAPSNWIRFLKNKHKMDYYAAVGQTTGSIASILLERFIFKKSIVQFENLDDAVVWALEKVKL